MASDHDGGYKRLFSQPRMVEDLLRGFVRGEWVARLDCLRFCRWRLYNGAERWWAKREITDLIEVVPGGLSVHLPRLRYLLLEERALATTEMPDGVNLAAALFRIEQSLTPAEVSTRIRDLVEWLPRGSDPTLRRAFVAWLRRVFLPGRFRDLSVPAVNEIEEFRDMLEKTVLRWTEEWKQQGLHEGRQEGLQQGLQRGLQRGVHEGVHRGQAELLSLQLETRFGALPPVVRARIDQAESTSLLRWAQRLLTAERLEDVFTA